VCIPNFVKQRPLAHGCGSLGIGLSSYQAVLKTGTVSLNESLY